MLHSSQYNYQTRTTEVQFIRYNLIVWSNKWTGCRITSWLVFRMWTVRTSGGMPTIMPKYFSCFFSAPPGKCKDNYITQDHDCHITANHHHHPIIQHYTPRVIDSIIKKLRRVTQSRPCAHHMWSGGSAPLSLNCETKCRQIISFMPWLLYVPG